MFLPAKYMATCTDRTAAMALLNSLENVSLQALEEVEHSTDFVMLDMELDCGTYTAPGHFILLTTPEGVKVYFANGLHLSSTVEGARMAFVNDSLDHILEEHAAAAEADAEPPAPVVCCVFEFAYQGNTHVRHLH